MKYLMMIVAASFYFLPAQANAQIEDNSMPGPTNGRPTESAGPMAPGNPNTSTTVVTPVVPDDDTDTMIYPSTNTGTSTRTLNSMTPSSGDTNNKTGATAAPPQ